MSTGFWQVPTLRKALKKALKIEKFEKLTVLQVLKVPNSPKPPHPPPPLIGTLPRLLKRKNNSGGLGEAKGGHADAAEEFNAAADSRDVLVWLQ